RGRPPLHVLRNRRARRPRADPRRTVRVRRLPRRSVARDGSPLALRLDRGRGARRARGRGVPRRASVGGARREGVRLPGAGAGGGDRAGGEVARRRPLVPLHQVPGGGRPHAHAGAPARTSEEGVTLVGMALVQAVKARALELGFDRVAIGPARLAHGAAFARWLDAGPVRARDLAAAAGLGFIGKNTNLIAPGLGSYFFIGLVLTPAELPADDAVPDRCGTCTACLDACPTAAFGAPYALDARRC